MGVPELKICSFEGLRKTVVSRFDLILLASNIVIGSLIDIDFTGGYWVLLFNTILSGIGYILLAYSLAEMTSALPFSGGIYGIVRAFLHPFMGFYISIFELMINLFYLAFAVHSLASLPKQAGAAQNDSNFLVFCLLVYICIFIVCLLGGKVFWYINNILGLLCIVIICIYILGAIPTANFSGWKHTDGPFTFQEVMTRLPGPSLTYLGIQYLPLNSKFTKDPKNDTPYVMIWTVAIIFVLCISVITVASSQYPGYDVLAREDHPLTYGFANIFGITLSQAHYLGFPSLFATCFTFLYSFGRQASSMASSGLLPEILKRELPIVSTPYIALLCVTICCMVFNIFLYYYEVDLLHRYLRICGLSTYIVFISFLVAYIQFKKNYSSLQRSISSPFGLTGAYLGIIIFIICMIAALGFQNRGYSEFILLALVSLTIIVIYVWVLGTQEFSEEEKNELFKAYLISANRQAKNRVRKGNRRAKYSTSALSDSGHRSGNKSTSDNGSDGKSSDIVNDCSIYPQNDPEADMMSDVGDVSDTRNISSSFTGGKISIHLSVNQDVKTKTGLRSSMVWSGMMVRKVLPTVANTETNDSILESCENGELASPS